MNPDIIIPTCKTPLEVSPLVCSVEGFSWRCKVIATCQVGKSAAVNRNIGLERSSSEIIIMIDDDTAGFFDGWWKEMIRPLQEDENIVIVSARLVKVDGTNGGMMFLGNINAEYLTEIPRCATACIAFRNDGTKFDENFEGSGFEDDDFCAQLYQKYPKAKTVINNRCKIIHINEMKNQSGVFWERNKAYFDKKWMTVSGGTVRIPHPERNAYHSEYQEDEWLNNHIFLGQRKGVFFECGAIDGIVHSNSLFFERALGWTGLCIEPNPDEFEKLKKNRICKAENYALWPEENKTIDFQKIKGGLRGWSAITESIEEQQKERIKTNIKPEDIEIIKVPTIRLSSILKKHGMKNIDFVSLDIEGAELDVLKDFPFDQFDIKIFLIENNFNNNSIEKIMNKAGYKKIIRLGVTDIYRKLEKKTLDSGISFARKVEAMNRIEELKKIPRVPLPDDVPDDDHNRIEGLLEMIVGYFPKNASVVELGTGRGVSTEVFALLCEKVITTDIKNDLKGDWSNAAAKVFLKYDNIKHFNMTSTKLASIMPDNSFDAVYIDAAHEYEAVKEDIMKWRPKIKKGGIICGHDYIDRPKYNFGIIRAVDEIFGKPDMVFKDTSWMVKLF